MEHQLHERITTCCFQLGTDHVTGTGGVIGTGGGAAVEVSADESSGGEVIEIDVDLQAQIVAGPFSDVVTGGVGQAHAGQMLERFKVGDLAIPQMPVIIRLHIRMFGADQMFPGCLQRLFEQAAFDTAQADIKPQCAVTINK